RSGVWGATSREARAAGGARAGPRGGRLLGERSLAERGAGTPVLSRSLHRVSQHRPRTGGGGGPAAPRLVARAARGEGGEWNLPARLHAEAPNEGHGPDHGRDAGGRGSAGRLSPLSDARCKGGGPAAAPPV